MPLLPHPSALYMHMEPRLTTVSPENTEGRDYPPTAMTDEDRSEIDRIMENYPMMDYPSSVSSTATTPTAQQPTSVSSATSSSSRSLDSTEAASTSPQHTLPQTNNFPPLLVDIKVITKARLGTQRCESSVKNDATNVCWSWMVGECRKNVEYIHVGQYVSPY